MNVSVTPGNLTISVVPKIQQLVVLLRTQGLKASWVVAAEGCFSFSWPLRNAIRSFLTVQLSDKQGVSLLLPHCHQTVSGHKTVTVD